MEEASRVPILFGMKSVIELRREYRWRSLTLPCVPLAGLVTGLHRHALAWGGQEEYELAGVSVSQ